MKRNGVLLTKKGKLTAYALHCGYIINKNNCSIMFEHNCYVVKTFADGFFYFDRLKDARKKVSNW